MRKMTRPDVPRMPAQRFTDYIWLNVRSSVVVSWAMVVTAFVLVYSGGLVILKSRQLHASLDIAAETVRESLIQATDWPLALGHLQALERSGHAFEITLRDKAQGSSLAGPFGSRPFGVGSLCAQEDVGGKFLLGGCMRVLELPEVYTLVFFVLFSVLVFLAALKFSQSKMLLFVNKVSDELDKISALDGGKEESPGGSSVFGIQEVDAIRGRVQNLLKAIEKSSAAQAFADLSQQVAHDIRSPLAALEAASEDIARLPEERRALVRDAVGRIQDIANDLLGKHRAGSAPTHAASAHLVSALIGSIVTEKRLQFRSRPNVRIETELDFASYGIFARVPPAEFQRVLSNLVNNAVEALAEGAGRVRVSLFARPEWAIISVKDDGAGIPPDVLARLGERGVSHDKAEGSGLGLHHARTSAESWGGRLELSSEPGTGTTAALYLPLADAPDWFASELILPVGKPVAVLDDDPSIHQIWQGRLDALKARDHGIELLTFSGIESFKSWVLNSPSAGEALFLLDYELAGRTETGLSLAEELGVANRAVLVTSRHEEPRVIESCRRLKVRVIPKVLAGLVPIRFSGQAPSDGKGWDAILIDDDPLVRRTWEIAAARIGKKIRTFPAESGFLKEAAGFARETSVYVDAHLADGERGEEVCRRVFELGFRRIYLATGYEPDALGELPHLRGIVGKDPPWTG